ncbi:MAG: HsdM family class I SAM-dependent methyltransferase [Fervidicoccaceae archaeon]|jgi:adenine-specific DNA-methyltransferase
MKMREYHPETLKYLEESDPIYRKRMGQFFTPRSLREELLSKLPRLERPKVLDPSCGTGEFLLSAMEHFIEPELHCWEADPRLVEIAEKVVRGAHVEHVDSLRKPFEEEFDVVLGNPPYFEFKPDEEMKAKFGEIIWGRPNIYAFFIYLGLKVLKPNGFLAYVVSSGMNNGAYFKKLRDFIVKSSDIVYMRVLDGNSPFDGANHTFQLLVLKKSENTGRYVFRRNGITIFSEEAEYLEKAFEFSSTLREMGYRVQTGKIVWNRSKDRLRSTPEGAILLIWSHNIKDGRLVLNNRKDKPQYIDYPIEKADRGPAIVAARITGHPKRAVLKAALVPPGTLFVAENHVNVIYPPQNASTEDMEEIVKQLNSPETRRILKILTGNTQISKTELEEMIPLGSKVPRKSSHP